jgi:hypothetical protein
VMDPEEACQRAIEAGLVVHCAHPLNGETSIPALIGGVVMPSAQYGRLRARRAIVNRRSRTPDPLATPTRPRGPHSGSARESSLPAGPAPRLQNPQPMSELRNHPRKLTPNSATFTRTGQRPSTHQTHTVSSSSRLRGMARACWGSQSRSGRSQSRSSRFTVQFRWRGRSASRSGAHGEAG